MHLLDVLCFCRDCDWEYEGRNGMASHHSKKFNHKVHVDLYYSHIFERK